MSVSKDHEFLTIPDVAEILGETPSRVRRFIEDRYLLAVRVDGVWKVPANFIKHGEVISAVRGTLILLQDAGFTDDEALTWMLSENEELGTSPISALAEGRKSSVRRATQSLAF